MSEAPSAAEDGGNQLDELVPIHHDNVSEGDDDRNGGSAEPISHWQD